MLLRVGRAQFHERFLELNRSIAVHGDDIDSIDGDRCRRLGPSGRTEDQKAITKGSEKIQYGSATRSLMLQGGLDDFEQNKGMVRGKDRLCAFQSIEFAAFDIHFQDIDPFETMVSDETVERDQADFFT
jgi:hypothetical protein